MTTTRFGVVLLMAIASLSLFAGCSSDEMTRSEVQQPFSPAGFESTDLFTDDDFKDQLKAGTFTVCKVAEGTDMKFTFNTLAEGPGVANAPVYEPTVMLGNGECADVYTAPVVQGADQVTITEELPEGWQVDRVAIWSLDHQEDGTFLTTFHELPAGTTQIQGAISAGKAGCVAIFYNSRIPRECTGEIGDFVWNDTGGTKGIQDPGEPGIGGVTVTLMDDTGATIATRVTDETGFYLFTGLCEGDYKVTVDETTIPEGFMQTPTDVGEDDCVDNNQNPTMVNLPADDSSNRCVDFGYMEIPRSPGTGTPGYWHKPENWPVDEITVGGVTYTKEEAAMYMTGGVKGDKSINLFRHTVSAMLNVIIGNDDSCIADTIDAADAWLATYPLGSGVRASSEAWEEGGPYLSELDDYNNGRLCAPHRD